MAAASREGPAGQPVLRDPETANSPDISKQSQNDLISTVSRQPELEPIAAPIVRLRVRKFGAWR
jgi:hypothetical protein